MDRNSVESTTPRKYFVFYGDDAVGGFGYWFADSEQEIRESVRGERFVDARRFGWFPIACEHEAVEILDECCTIGDVLELDARLSKIGGHSYC